MSAYNLKSKNSISRILFIAGLFSISHVSPLWAADPASPAPAGKHKEFKHEMSVEQRAKMADHMNKMADCLRSEKTMEACRLEMKASCEANMDMCPMMDHHMGMGKMRLQDSKKSKSEKK